VADVKEETPLVVKILAWFLIIVSMLFLIKIAFFGSDFSLQRGIWNGFVKFLAFVAGVGFLKLKKWAVYLYFGAYMMSTAVFFLMPPNEQVFEIYTRLIVIVSILLIPGVIGFIVWRYWQRFA
jgi:hypothetical protein